MIQVEDLSKYYGDFAAVKNLTFDVKKGEIMGFLGPNGAGKTTTMRILAGFMPASSGVVKVAGYDVFREPMKAKQQIGYLPEIPPLYYDMSVSYYLDFVGKLRGLTRKRRKERVGEVAERCGLKEKYRTLIRKLSKGYRQRLGVAQALIHDPPVLILDEPTIGLDPRQIVEIRELIKGLKENRTIILSTHILPEVTQTCDKILIIHRGRAVALDTLENLTRKMDLEEAFIQLVEEAEGAG